MARIWRGRRTDEVDTNSGRLSRWGHPLYGGRGRPMGGGFIDPPYPAPPPTLSRDTTLDPGPAYFVSVCGFTFEFWSVPQVEAALRFYRDKVHPGSRMPPCGERSDLPERWYERLPLCLQENGKRERVVKALERALKAFG